jgi:hypothetical protein
MDGLDRVMALRADIRKPRASRLKEARDYATRKEERDSNAMRADRIGKSEATEVRKYLFVRALNRKCIHKI